MRQRLVLMIMDDNDISQDTLTQIFYDGTIKTIFSTMKSAKRMLESKAFLIDAVVLYIFDEESEGYNLLKFMNAQRYTEHIPIVIVDTQEQSKEGAAENVYDYGVCEVITDPCDCEEIMSRLHELLDSKECQKMLICVFNGIANVMNNLYEFDMCGCRN